MPQATSTSYDDSTWTNHATRRTINSYQMMMMITCSQWKLIQQVTRTALIYSPPRLPLLILFIVSVDATILKPTNGFFFFSGLVVTFTTNCRHWTFPKSEAKPVNKEENIYILLIFSFKFETLHLLNLSSKSLNICYKDEAFCFMSR